MSIKNINKDHFIEITKNSLTMGEASTKLDLHFNTFKKYAIKFGVYKPNQGGKGKKKGSYKEGTKRKYKLEDIIVNKYPQYHSNKLRIRLIKEGIKKEKCEICNIEEWNGKKVSFELNHKDGNRFNHKLNNLEIICPNCHSQTSTYRGKNKSKTLH